MRLKKRVVLIVCVCVCFILTATKVKAEEENVAEKKNNLIKTIKNETNLNDEEKTKLLIPCMGIITSKYGYRNVVSSTASKNHKGIDIGAERGTEILAAHDGIVLKAENMGNYGNCTIIQNKEYVTLYAHCSKIFVSEGAHVVRGEKIAEVGMTGNATGNHLHFEVIKNGEHINPEDVIDW